MVEGLKALSAGEEGKALAEFEKAASLPDAAWMAGMLRLRREEFGPARRHLEETLGVLDELGSLLEKYGTAAQVTLLVTPEVDTHARPRARYASGAKRDHPAHRGPRGGDAPCRAVAGNRTG